MIGAGPCGLRAAVELSFLGARVVVLEKRDAFSRNNVLHLWPFAIHDLRGLGAKKFYGKFCAGSIDHISERASQRARRLCVGRASASALCPSAGIRQLQLVLLKVALLLGVEVHVNVEFKRVLEPPRDQRLRSEPPADLSRAGRVLAPAHPPVFSPFAACRRSRGGLDDGGVAKVSRRQSAAV